MKKDKAVAVFVPLAVGCFPVAVCAGLSGKSGKVAIFSSSSAVSTNSEDRSNTEEKSHISGESRFATERPATEHKDSKESHAYGSSRSFQQHAEHRSPSAAVSPSEIHLKSLIGKLESGAFFNPNERDNYGNTVFINAVYHAFKDGELSKHKDMLEDLLGRGADINLRDQRGYTVISRVLYLSAQTGEPLWKTSMRSKSL